MQRDIPILTRRSLENESSPDATIFFATISHPEIDGVIRLVADGEDWLFNGQTYYKGGFELTLLTDSDAPPTARFTFPNVKREVMTRMERVTSPAEVTFDAISSVYFDITKVPRQAKAGVTPLPFYHAGHLLLTDVKVTVSDVSGTLRSRDFRQEIWPGRRATPELTPGVWP